MTIPIKARYNAVYLNIMSESMKELKLPQFIVLDILSGRQAIVNSEKWVSRIDLEKLIRPDLELSSPNDDAIG